MPFHPLHIFAGFPPLAQRRFPKGYLRVLTGTACTQRCGLCPFPHDDARSQRSPAEIRGVVREAVRRRARGILFGGGEPTAHPQIEALLTDARQRGLGVGLISNGVALANIDFRARLVAAGLGRVQIHLYSPDPERHAEVGGPGADLEASLEAIRTLSSQDVEVLAVLPLFQQNLGGLDTLMDRLARSSVPHLHFTVPEFVEPPWTKADPVELAEKVRAALVDERFPRTSFDRIPLCLLPERLPFYLRVAHRDPIPRPQGSREDLSWLCRDCAASQHCEAPATRGMDLKQAGQLAPYLVTVSNSLNYVPKRVIAEFSSLDECPLRSEDSLLPDLHPERDILIYPSHRLMIVGTDSADFDDGEIRHIRHELGQLYLDISDKVLLDDFEHDLANLRTDKTCTACPRFGECPGAYSLAPLREGFRESQERLQSILMSLRGRVLDVGVGEPHSLASIYAHWKSPGAEGKPLVTYVGIEPEARRIRELHVLYSDLDIRELSAETPDLLDQLGGPGDLFDHVLLLRSYNHLTDLYAAFTNLIALLRPGGTMVVVDNTAFALVRSRKKIRDVRSTEIEGAAPFEHYRNHRSEDALEVLLPFGMEVVEHHPVRPDTANQWILVLRKKESAEHGAG